ncbi:MAG TPA: Maf family protein [Chloroflexota bacterium]|nr:Maf family protein [Chloroflexota bacterium]
MLSSLGVSFEVIPSGIDEPPPRWRQDPAAYALELAKLKAADVAARYPDDVILGADTVVSLGDHFLGKPRDEQDAAEMLTFLAGREHQVSTGVAIHCGYLRGDAVTTRVFMRSASLPEIEDYVRTGEPMDKAGAYGIQGLGGKLVDRIDGCYNSVVGLPLCLTANLLAHCGVEVRAPRCCDVTEMHNS